MQTPENKKNLLFSCWHGIPITSCRPYASRGALHAFCWHGIADLDFLVSWVESFGDDFETWFTLGGQEPDPNGSLYIRIPGATIYDLAAGEFIVRVAPGMYAPYTKVDMHAYFPSHIKIVSNENT